ncbi:MAG: class F sortase [Actinomycetota bacterium]
MQPARLAVVTLALVLVGAGCGGGEALDEAGAGVVAVAAAPAANPAGDDPVTTTSESPDSDASAGADTESPELDASGGERELSPLASQVVSAGSVLYDLDAPLPDTGPVPIGLTIDGIDITDAPIIDVGVEPNGEMEIPGATEIGWYRWSPTPGSAGSSVLAAHIAWNGRDGVFRDLDDVEVGERFTVHYDDGTSREFVATEKAQYAKEELPFDRVFSKQGEPTLVLITCGGDFNRGLNSYDDNVVVYADPV